MPVERAELEMFIDSPGELAGAAEGMEDLERAIGKAKATGRDHERLAKQLARAKRAAARFGEMNRGARHRRGAVNPEEGNRSASGSGEAVEDVELESGGENGSHGLAKPAAAVRGPELSSEGAATENPGEVVMTSDSMPMLSSVGDGETNVAQTGPPATPTATEQAPSNGASPEVPDPGDGLGVAPPAAATPVEDTTEDRVGGAGFSTFGSAAAETEVDGAAAENNGEWENAFRAELMEAIETRLRQLEDRMRVNRD